MDNLICHSEMSNFFSIQWTTYLNLSSTQSHRTRKKFMKMAFIKYSFIKREQRRKIEGLTCNAIANCVQSIFYMNGKLDIN